WLHGLWRFRRIYSDASAHAVNDLLRAKSIPVEPVSFSLQGKVELYGRLKATLEADRLVLPQHAALLRELSTFEYRISTSGNLLLHASAGGHDDFPDSLALAARTLTRSRPDDGPGFGRLNAGPWSRPNRFEPRAPDASGPRATPIE